MAWRAKVDEALAKLRANSVTKLNLSLGHIPEEGATALAKALETNASLQKLYLGSNQIGDGGATALAKALETNASLK